MPGLKECKMKALKRFGVSLEKELLGQFDRLLRKRGYTNRSKALADLVRGRLVEETWEEGGEVVGTITMLFDHHKRELSERLTELQHEFYRNIISSQHIHLDQDNCLEVIIVRGKASLIRKLTSLMAARKGVKHVRLTITSTGKGLK
jgi:CopG family nickel-responsive transcriptional regulator